MTEREHEAEYKGMEGGHAIFQLSDGTTLRLPQSVLKEFGAARSIILRPPPELSGSPTDPRIHKLNQLIHGKLA
ncbi:MAG: hypothetical protein HY566_00945 [Candidatus Kerfeldbacteria bacterium]|nr:hypothetical protein [Candidatus Kerfeldbacteria bacterium]